MAAIYIIAAFCLILSSCVNSDNIIYSNFKSIDVDGWSNSQYLEFQLDSIADGGVVVDVLLVVRHSENYDFESLCLVKEEVISNCDVRTDTIEIRLADSEGRLMGRGHNGLYEVVDTLHSSVKIEDNYLLSISHGMREKLIVGVNDIGIIIRKQN